jgi:hypothetical protein
MNTTKKFICLGLLAAWCFAPAISFAAKCAGTNINNVVSWEPAGVGWELMACTAHHQYPGAAYQKPPPQLFNEIGRG